MNDLFNPQAVAFHTPMAIDHLSPDLDEAALRAAMFDHHASVLRDLLNFFAYALTTDDRARVSPRDLWGQIHIERSAAATGRLMVGETVTVWVQASWKKRRFTEGEAAKVEGILRRTFASFRRHAGALPS